MDAGWYCSVQVDCEAFLQNTYPNKHVVIKLFFHGNIDERVSCSDARITKIRTGIFTLRLSIYRE